MVKKPFDDRSIRKKEVLEVVKLFKAKSRENLT
jgi:hypothetical protein